MSEKIKIYTCQRMTGRVCSEVRQEADMLVRVVNEYGFVALNPVIEERIPYTDDIIAVTDSSVLETYWKRDKELIRESDVVLDYKTQNRSDGTNKELAYSRYCLWKPTVRVWDGDGGNISRIEDDAIVPTLAEALCIVQKQWGSYEKLRQWRVEMLSRCVPAWMEYQQSLLNRYGGKYAFYPKITKTRD